MRLSAVLRKTALFVCGLFSVWVWPFPFFMKNIGRRVKKQTVAKISQLRQSIKLTEGWPIGRINNSAAAAIIPRTDRRSMCMVRLK